MTLTHHFPSYLQKADKRKLALEAKQSFSKEKKESIRKCLIPEFMSSEDEERYEDGGKYFLIKPLPWRSDTFQKDIKILDQKYKDFIETDKGRNQKCPRELGGFSKRPKPIIPNGCEWACKN